MWWWNDMIGLGLRTLWRRALLLFAVVALLLLPLPPPAAAPPAEFVSQHLGIYKAIGRITICSCSSRKSSATQRKPPPASALPAAEVVSNLLFAAMKSLAQLQRTGMSDDESSVAPGQRRCHHSPPAL